MSDVTDLDGGFRVDEKTECEVAQARATVSIAVSLKRIADVVEKLGPSFDLLNAVVDQLQSEAIDQAMTNVMTKVSERVRN